MIVRMVMRKRTKMMTNIKSLRYAKDCCLYELFVLEKISLKI